VRCDNWAEEIVDIADHRDGDYEISKDGKAYQVREAVHRSKLRMEGRQWVMSRLLPQQWGDKQQINIKDDWSLLSEDERRRRADELISMIRELREPPVLSSTPRARPRESGPLAGEPCQNIPYDRSRRERSKEQEDVPFSEAACVKSAHAVQRPSKGKNLEQAETSRASPNEVYAGTRRANRRAGCLRLVDEACRSPLWHSAGDGLSMGDKARGLP
jgi:hypothetical protein